MSNIIQIPAKNKTVVAFLEDLLTQARSGDLVHVALVGITKNEDVMTGQAWGDDAQPFTVLGGLQYLSTEISLSIGFE